MLFWRLVGFVRRMFTRRLQGRTANAEASGPNHLPKGTIE